MRFKCRNFLVGVVVEDPQLEVVGTGDKPVLARDKSNTSDRDLRDLECFYNCAGFVVVDIDRAII